MTDLDELERKARAAAEHTAESDWDHLAQGVHFDGYDEEVVEFVRAANPAVILALIERVRAADARKPVSLPFDGLIGSDGQLYPKDAL